MRTFPWISLGVGLLLTYVPVAQAALTPAQIAQLPQPANRAVDFQKDIQPIFQVGCVKCHGHGAAKGGFSLEDRAALLRGGDSGPTLVPGQSAQSLLIELVSGLNPDNVMPRKGSKLNAEQVALLRAWIDQGAPWDERVRFAKAPPANLAPASPAIPTGPAAITHPIDRFLLPYFQAHGGPPAPTVSDRVFARRVYLDVIGLLPSPAELKQFLSDHSPDRRVRLVDRLLSDDRRFAEHWLTFWNDLLRNDYKGTGYIDGGREQITRWLFQALSTNMPFDQFVRELVNPNPGSLGFTKGIVWRGVVNASQTPQMQAAQNISQVFMGVNLKCASCHDSFINDWKLADAYGLASVYADQPLEMVHCDKPTGKTAEIRFIYPELGGIEQAASKTERLQQLARLLTSEQNGRLTRTIVNRLWARFLGRGLVEPVDDMEQAAWHPELLSWLAADLAAHRYDLRHAMRRILTSQAYALPAQPAVERAEPIFVFRGPLVRRLTAEQYVDAVSQLTGVWHERPVASVDFASSRPPQPGGPAPAKASWIWSESTAQARAAAETLYLRRSFHLDAIPAQALAVVTCDNRCKVFLNGHEVGTSSDFQKPTVLDLRPRLMPGANVLTVEATNDPANPSNKDADQANPAGFLFQAEFRVKTKRGQSAAPPSFALVSDRTWTWSREKSADWPAAKADSASWSPCAELGPNSAAPWQLESAWASALASLSVMGQVRASLVNNDPLMLALGRPNREQVTTTRPSQATTLQALELTNGATLSEWVDRGADRWLSSQPADPRSLVRAVYQTALGRLPTTAEWQAARQFLGGKVRKEGVADLLWTVSMLPEFQLIL